VDAEIIDNEGDDNDDSVSNIVESHVITEEAEERDVDVELIEQEQHDLKSKCKEIPDDDVEADETSDSEKASEDDSIQEAREPIDLVKLKEDLGRYMPRAKKILVRVMADELDAIPIHADNLPETKR
jgi:hypothetical protein